MTPSSPPSSPKSTDKADPSRPGRRGLFLRGALALAAVSVGFGAAEAYVRIKVNGVNLKWNNPTITWQLNNAGSDDIPDGSHEAAIEHAFQTWQDVNGSKLVFNRGADTASTNAGASSSLVLFDEDNSSGYFPGGSGIVAITPISFDVGSGNILDADILFNGRDYTFSTDNTPGTFDVQDVITHEIGHFVGLDHAPNVSASMWPYVATNQWLHRSLTQDDEAGAVAVAQQGNQSVVTGRIERASDDSAVSGAVVSALRASDGRLVAMALSSGNGNFTIKSLPAGDYWLHVTPLEGGMSSANLTGNGSVQTDFAPAFYGNYSVPTVFNVAGPNDSVNAGTLAVPADTTMRETTSGAVLLRRGQSAVVTVFGTGFNSGSMTMTAKSPHVSVSNITSGASFVRGTVTIGAGAPYGSYDLFLKGITNFEVASGAIEVVADPPALNTLSTGTGATSGGETVTLSGTGFQDGAWVLFGGVEAPSVSFTSSTTLQVTTPASTVGTVDVAVFNPDGQTARLDDGFTFTGSAVFSGLVPAAGQAAGGSTVYLAGSNLSASTTVLFGGQPATVLAATSNALRLRTPAHASGTVDIVLQNTGSPDTTVVDGFTYLDAGDPSVISFTPSKGPKGGGTKVRFTGTGLDGIASVKFGVDPVTGQGGKNAAAMDVLGATSVEATTQSNSSAGNFGMLLVNAEGAGVLAEGFTFEGSNQVAAGASSGGGCAAPLDGRGGDARGELPGLVLLLLGYGWLRRRLGRRPAPVRVPVGK
jgi:hypothetical protein